MSAGAALTVGPGGRAAAGGPFLQAEVAAASERHGARAVRQNAARTDGK